MDVHLIKLESKKFSKRLFPETLGDLTLDLLGAVVHRACYTPVLEKPVVTSRNPLQVDSDLVERLSNNPDKVLCFSANVGNVRDSAELARVLSTRTPYRSILFGGPTFDHSSARVLLEDYPFIDAVALGHGEKTLPPILDAIQAKTIPPIKGFLYRQDGEIRETPGFELLTDQELEESPLPLMKNLANTPMQDRSRLRVLVRTSTGCNGFCTFCYLPVKKWSRMSAKRVGETFDQYTQEGFRKFIIIDDNFIGTDRQRARDIAQILRQTKEKYHDFAFEFDARADSFGTYEDAQFDSDLIAELKKSGLEKIFVGLESGNNIDLNTFKKSARGIDALKQNKYFLEKVKHFGIEVVPGFVMLNENSTFTQVRDNIAFLGGHLPGQLIPEVYCYTLSYYPSAALTRRKRQELIQGGQPDKARNLLYGEYNTQYTDPRIGDFAGILNKVRKRFASLDDDLVTNDAQLNKIKARSGQALSGIHTRYFTQYAAMAESGQLSDVDRVIEEHYATTRSAIETASTR